ncbi:MAG: hypothetical protein HYV16_08130 [Gammaproteobacteria bacterium]|nr:hypothetical protein [Gammaproteobacteria bacterium]
MYAQIPPPPPDGRWTDWRADLVRRQPRTQGLLLAVSRAGYRLRRAAAHAREIVHELREDREHGLRFWRAHQAQEAERLGILGDLRTRLAAPDFALSEVSATFAKLVLKKDDAGMAQWFGDAHVKLEQALARQGAQDAAEPELFKEAVKELRFLSEMPEFYARYALQELENQVKTMHEALLARIDALSALRRDQLEAAKAQAAVDAANAEAARLKAEAARLAEENARIAALKDKLAEENRRSAERREMMAAEERKALADEQLARQRAERERQEALQKDYLRMQEEERLKQAMSQARTLESQLELVTLAVSARRYNPADPIIANRLEALRQALGQSEGAPLNQ